MDSGRHATIKCRCKGVHDEEGQHLCVCFFLNAAGVASQFKGREEFNDVNRIP